jgi:hypothetical protein
MEPDANLPKYLIALQFIKITSITKFLFVYGLCGNIFTKQVKGILVFCPHIIVLENDWLANLLNKRCA